MDKSSQTNRKSYFVSTLFIMPVLVLGNTLVQNKSSFSEAGVVTTIMLLPLFITLTSRRLINSGHSPWWSIALLPPFTIFPILFALIAPTNKELFRDYSLYIFGIRAKGLKLIPVVIISLILTYLSILFVVFLSDGV